MRVLLFVNLIAVVVLAGALARMYEGAALPWAVPSRPAATPTREVVMPPASLPVPQVRPRRPEERLPASPLRVLTEGTYPPFNYRGADGLLTGFDVELARALCERMTRECRFETHRWADLLPLLARGQGDAVVASMLVPSPGREAVKADAGIVFMRYYATPGHFAARRGDARATAGAAALSGSRIALQSGSIHEAFLKRRFPGAVTVGAPSLEEAEKMLAEGGADLLFGDRNALARWTMTPPGASCCRLVGTDYADPAFFGSGAGMALRASDADLRDEFERALQAVIDDGTYASISMRYFGRNIR